MIYILESLFTQFAGTARCSSEFFGLKSWHHYLEKDGTCNIVNFEPLPKDGVSDFVLVAMAILDDLLRVAGFVAIGYIIYGGILYVTSQGSPDQTGKAQNTILNALIGLVVAIIAVAFVSFIGNKLG